MEIMHGYVGAGCDKKFGSWLSKQACLWENVIHNSERDQGNVQRNTKRHSAIDLRIFVSEMLNTKRAWFSQFQLILLHFRLSELRHYWVYISEFLCVLGEE